MIGLPAGASYSFSGDEHGAIRLPPGSPRPAIGARVLIGATHCDPTVNLHDWYVCVRGNRVEQLWPITARGRCINS